MRKIFIIFIMEVDHHTLGFRKPCSLLRMLLVGLQCVSVSSLSYQQNQPTQGPQIHTGFTPPPPTSNNSLDLCDSSQPPKLSGKFNSILIGQVISTEKVFSDIQCIDSCLRSLSCKAYNMESRGSKVYCITLATIERIQGKNGSSYRLFDREKIEKFLFQRDTC